MGDLSSATRDRTSHQTPIGANPGRAENDRLRPYRVKAAEMHAGNVDQNLVVAGVLGGVEVRYRTTEAMSSTGIDPMVVMKMLSRATTTEASYC